MCRLIVEVAIGILRGVNREFIFQQTGRIENRVIVVTNLESDKPLNHLEAQEQCCQCECGQEVLSNLAVSLSIAQGSILGGLESENNGVR